MRSGRRLLASGAMLLLTLGLAACSSGPSEEELAAQQTEQDWAWLEQAKGELDGMRQQLKELKAEAASEEEADGDEATDETAEGAEPGPGLDEQIATLRTDIETKSQELSGRVIDFINNQDIAVDEELTDIQRQAFDMKADEDIVVAQEYIDKGGDYSRAIDIYTTSLLSDPTSEKLLAAKTEAEELRHMNKERLDQVKKGMSREEVRALLGTPKGSNVREFEAGVVGWYYPRVEPGAAAAVFFQEKKGKLAVYKTDFEALKAREEADAES